MRRRPLLALLLALGAGGARAAADPMQPAAPQMGYTPPAAGSYVLARIQRVPAGTLLDPSGRSLRLAEVTHGKLTLLTFFYSYCTDPLGCPFAESLMRGLRDELQRDPARAAQLRFVSISLDPTHDRPEVLRRHAGGLADGGPLEWRFLTARSAAALLPLLDDFGQDVSVQRDAGGRPLRALNHMLKLFLIDAEGWVREIYALDYLHPAMMLNDIETLRLERARTAP